MNILNHEGTLSELLVDMLVARVAPVRGIVRTPLSEEQVSQVRQLRAEGVKRADIAEAMGISVHTVIAILAGRRHSARR